MLSSSNSRSGNTASDASFSLFNQERIVREVGLQNRRFPFSNKFRPGVEDQRAGRMKNSCIEKHLPLLYASIGIKKLEFPQALFPQFQKISQTQLSICRRFLHQPIQKLEFGRIEIFRKEQVRLKQKSKSHFFFLLLLKFYNVGVKI